MKTNSTIIGSATPTRYASFLLVIVVILFSWVLHNPAFAQIEKKLLSDAVRTISGISDDIDIKDKLSRYEDALGKLDEIMENHAASDIGIGLLTNQKIGTFDPNKLRSKYLNLLFDYQDTVCEKTLSYLCMGYVSL
jgi:hypothetical protein